MGPIFLYPSILTARLKTVCFLFKGTIVLLFSSLTQLWIPQSKMVLDFFLPQDFLLTLKRFHDSGKHPFLLFLGYHEMMRGWRYQSVEDKKIWPPNQTRKTPHIIFASGLERWKNKRCFKKIFNNIWICQMEGASKWSEVSHLGSKSEKKFLYFISDVIMISSLLFCSSPVKVSNKTQKKPLHDVMKANKDRIDIDLKAKGKNCQEHCTKKFSLHDLFPKMVFPANCPIR